MPTEKLPPLPEAVHFGHETCSNLTLAERREWWLANGLGAYAGGTLAGTLTRRYHGLLIAPVYPPLGRVLVLAKADATLVDGERTWPLFTNRWTNGIVSPAGNIHIESFRLEGRMPVWRYNVGTGWVEQRIWMEYGANTTYVAWRFEPFDPNDCRPRMLRVNLLTNARDHHGKTRPDHYDPVIEANNRDLRVMQPASFTLHVHACNGKIVQTKSWFENFDLLVERERGLDSLDSHRYGIGIDPVDGLLRAGEPGVQLTWMDAKVNDWVVTPRIGKPVEINALWFNALHIMMLVSGP